MIRADDVVDGVELILEEAGQALERWSPPFRRGPADVVAITGRVGRALSSFLATLLLCCHELGDLLDSVKPGPVYSTAGVA